MRIGAVERAQQPWVSAEPGTGISDAVVTADGQMTDAELQSLVHAGALEHVLHGIYCLAGSQDVALRAEVIHRLAAPRLAAGFTIIRDTAAWVWCGGTPPRVLSAAVGHGHRPGAAAHGPRWDLVQCDLAASSGRPAPAEADVEQVGPLRITHRLRTAADLLTHGGVDEVRTAARLLSDAELRQLSLRLYTPSRRPGIVRARRRLEALLAVQVR
ncbi:MAG: hypothetical protein Q4G34_01890 [Micrococcus sp.]|nr:hypothetical protein [Micrococcus sp.]